MEASNLFPSVLSSKPLLSLNEGRFKTEPFLYGPEEVGAGLIAVTVTGPMT